MLDEAPPPQVGAGWPGLTGAEVAERVTDGRVNTTPPLPERTLGQIVRANVLTLFNAIVASLSALVLVFGDWRDSLFVMVIVFNTGIGIVQELRAKRTLDRLAVVGEASPVVRRDGGDVTVTPPEVVLDDVVVVGPGDRVVVDGQVLHAEGLEVDESLLTGEADPVAKRPGDDVLSGSFVVAGSGLFRVTKVGAAAYAVQLAEEAKRFSLVRSELMRQINQILRVMVAVMVPVGALLVWRQLTLESEPLGSSVVGAVAGVVTMLPEGLVLLTSIAFAVGVVRLAQLGVLVQELPAIEGLARVDVLCVDKTGTLTETDMSLVDVVHLPAASGVDVDAVLAGMVASDPQPNPTLTAIGERFPASGSTARRVVPFSSVRKWAAAELPGLGGMALGAPDVLLDAADPVLRTVAGHAARGVRVVMLAAVTLSADDELSDVRPLALVLLEQRLKPDAAETLRYFADQGVEVKVLSGDSPVTVGAVAEQLGLVGSASEAVDAQPLGDDLSRGGRAGEEEVSRSRVFGRVTPRQKQRMVHLLQARGHVVAMTGDGVNDVLALKDADLGIAMASGSEASRAVAEIVLVDNRFEHLPSVVDEGRRVIGNVERVANLFLTKTVYAATLSLLSGVVGLPFPFLPRQLTVVTAFTLGVPGFFLALLPNRRRARGRFVRRVVRFAVPAGLVAAAASFTTYGLGVSAEGLSRDQAQSLGAIVLFVVVWGVLGLVAWPLDVVRAAVMVAMATGFTLVLAVPWLREFFAFSLSPPVPTALALAVGGASVALLVPLERLLGWRPEASAAEAQ
jgi:cation-transporting P-type ATPase E